MACTSAITIPTPANVDTNNGGDSSKNSPSLSSSSLSSPSSGSSTPQASSASSDNFDPWLHHRRRPSLLSTSFCRAEHTTLDLGVRDGNPRVITYVKTSQGFDWNKDIFLPSSSDITIHNGINQPESVHEIVLDEVAMFD